MIDQLESIAEELGHIELDTCGSNRQRLNDVRLKLLGIIKQARRNESQYRSGYQPTEELTRQLNPPRGGSGVPRRRGR